MNNEKCRIIIAGGRDFDDYNTLKIIADGIINNLLDLNMGDVELEIISGCARGADRLGERYAKENGIALVEFPADWDGHGKQAGVIRNRQMAKYATEAGYNGILIAFWDGKSKGTKNMIETAGKLNVKVCVSGY